jgi:hypothetical protein
MQLTNSIFQELSFQITQGNPWWGMLLVNEYLKEHDYLRNALTMRFLKRVTPRQRDELLVRYLVNGATARQLPARLRSTIGSRFVRTARTTHFSQNRLEIRKALVGIRRSGRVRCHTIARPFAARGLLANARTSESGI